MNQLGIDVSFMQQALACAKQSIEKGEVPVGAILVINNQAIVKAYNQTITQCDPTAHAEILVLRQAAKQMANHRLVEATLYVTLEPCLMCLGAMIQARIKRLVFAAYDAQQSVRRNTFDILQREGINHRFLITDGLLAHESVDLLKTFFLARRNNKSTKN